VALNSSCSLPGVLMRREPREARSPLKVATSRSAIHRYAMTRQVSADFRGSQLHSREANIIGNALKH
jgi:hypothetical protein